MNGRIVLRVVLALIVIAGMVVAGLYVYNIGVAQGLAASGKLSLPEMGAVPYPYFGGPFFYHQPFGFGFGFLGCLFPLLVLLLVLALLRGMRHGRWEHGMHHGPWEKGVPPMFEEWHRKMHESQPGDSNRA